MKLDADEDELSIHDTDDDIDYKTLNRYLKEDNERNKNSFANSLSQHGEEMLAEIQLKNTRKEIKKNKQILYILKHTKLTYNNSLLESYSFEDVQQIYDETKKKNESKFVKFIHFLFNIK